MIDYPSVAVHAFSMHTLTSFSVDEIWLTMNNYVCFGFMAHQSLYIIQSCLYTYIKYIYDLETILLEYSQTSLKLFLHIVKWFQVLLYNSHSLTSVLFAHVVGFIWPINRTLSSATTLGLSGHRSWDSKGVLHIPQIFKAGLNFISKTIVGQGVLQYCRVAVDVFYTSNQFGHSYSTAPAN